MLKVARTSLALFLALSQARRILAEGRPVDTGEAFLLFLAVSCLVLSFFDGRQDPAEPEDAEADPDGLVRPADAPAGPPGPDEGPAPHPFRANAFPGLEPALVPPGPLPFSAGRGNWHESAAPGALRELALVLELPGVDAATAPEAVADAWQVWIRCQVKKDEALRRMRGAMIAGGFFWLVAEGFEGAAPPNRRFTRGERERLSRLWQEHGDGAQLVEGETKAFQPLRSGYGQECTIAVSPPLRGDETFVRYGVGGRRDDPRAFIVAVHAPGCRFPYPPAVGPHYVWI